MTLHYEDGQVTLHHGDALDVTRTLPDGLAQTIVTSPPYFGLRDYGEEGQIGAEDSLDDYVARLVDLFRELRRVLADDGTLWLNLGDSYSGSWGNQGRKEDRGTQRPITKGMIQPVLDGRYGDVNARNTGAIRPGCPPAKNLIGVPWRVAFALQADGWILRSDIIWHKPNPMPESVADRPTKSHEYLFLFAKSPRYYYDAEAIKEPALTGYNGSDFTTGKTGVHQQGRASKQPRFGGSRYGDSDDPMHATKSGNEYQPNGLANKRTVWTVPTVPFTGAHFAVYPPDLIRPCIRAGSRPGDVVLDPFSGSGTTGAVATFEGRRYVGIDLNREYLDLSLRTRFQQPALPWDAA